MKLLTITVMRNGKPFVHLPVVPLAVCLLILGVFTWAFVEQVL